MSNHETTKLYETIIEDVISESRQDFENNGIDESTLQDLRRIWCEKLTQSQVAKFSWDDEHDDGDVGVVREESIPIVGNDVILGDAGLVPDEFHSQTNDMGIELPNMQGGHDSGLMLPNIGQSDGTFEFTVDTNDKNVFNLIKKKNVKSKVQQVDGSLDDDEDDEEGIFNDSDDINSDLDDDLESEKSDEDEGDQEGQIMLCLYDKVQRIKNKWKSNLKEGIANIDGKDYVFQKATGESEW